MNPHPGQPELPVQSTSLADGINYNLADGHDPPMLEPQAAITVSANDMNMQNDIVSNEPVKCKKEYLHGNLIRDLPHLCSRHQIGNNKRGDSVYKKKVECGFPKCKAIFNKARQFHRHYRTVHIRATDGQRLDCTVEGCRRTGEEGFSRKDNLIEHLRSVHGEEIPKNPVRFNGSKEQPWVPRLLRSGRVDYIVKGTSSD